MRLGISQETRTASQKKTSYLPARAMGVKGVVFVLSPASLLSLTLTSACPLSPLLPVHPFLIPAYFWIIMLLLFSNNEL